ncbi:aminopeptidase [Breznakiellaceae bacterium SP9]
MSDNENDKKTPGQQLAEKLLFEIKNCWETATDEETKEIQAFAGAYKEFLNKGKTEREIVHECVQTLNAQGFVDFDTILNTKDKDKLKSGQKVYQNIRGKSLIAAVIGTEPITAGINILGAHVDSPRIDLKPNPLYEDSELALLDSHYYGGIKFYQWTAIPLAMHGIILGKDGTSHLFAIGENEDDPIFTITDLLPHLARDQMAKKASEFLGGEELDILAGSEPYKDAKVKDKVKLKLLSILNTQYNIVEEDFASAELEFVPAFKARDLGFDRSMVGAYGHDDRSCTYASFRALQKLAADSASESKPPKKTSVCLLTDKEEIGSMGNTGAQSRLFENFIAFLGSKTISKFNNIDLRYTLSRSFMLSADVNAAFDPNFSSVYDKKTASFFGKGVVLTKYTGHGGKAGGSEANAEYCRKVQSLFDAHKVRWQFGDLGKVNQGGGGTIAQYAANLGIEVLDCGVPVLSMHSPFEVISKIDLFSTYRGFLAFLQDA